MDDLKGEVLRKERFRRGQTFQLWGPDNNIFG